MEITAQLVKQLREMTGVGMMDCKKALVAKDGNLEEAVKYLREKGLSKAAEKAGRDTKEGRIFSYIHTNYKVGVMLEVNCETDFVARTDDFAELCSDIAVHICASSPMAISENDIDPKLLENEREIYYQKAINDGKPVNIAEKVAEGQVKKFISENCLLHQEYALDDNKKVSDIISEAVMKMGENIQVARFVRFVLGE